MALHDLELYKAQRDVKMLTDDNYYYLDNPKVIHSVCNRDFHNHILMQLDRLNNEIKKVDNVEGNRQLRNFRTELKTKYRNLTRYSYNGLSDIFEALCVEYADCTDGKELYNSQDDEDVVITMEKFLSNNMDTPLYTQLEHDLIDFAMTSDNYSFEDNNEFMEVVQNFVDQAVMTFPDEKFNYNEAIVALGHIVTQIMDIISSSTNVASVLFRDPTMSVLLDYAHPVAIKKDNLAKLFTDFKDEYVTSGNSSPVAQYYEQRFQYGLLPLKNRTQYSASKEIIVDTCELEELVMMGIVNWTPLHMKTFVRFLKDNKIVLPLSEAKQNIYASALINFSNEDIQQTFNLEGEEMVNMDEFRKKTLSKKQLSKINSNLIHLDDNVNSK